MAKKRKRPCVYCGKPMAGTVDHVPPQCFFPDPKPPNMITVPCCAECNRGAWYGATESIDSDEEYTRNFMVWVSEHPAAQQLLDTPVISTEGEVLTKGGEVSRAIEKNQRLKDLLRESFHYRDVSTSSGQVVGQKLTLDFDPARFGRVIRKIVRGLYYYELNEAFAPKDDINVMVLSLPPYIDRTRASGEAIQYLVEKLPHPGGRRLGHGVFSYQFVRDPKRPDFSLWAMSFYDDIFVAAATFPRGTGTRTIGPNDDLSSMPITLPYE